MSYKPVTPRPVLITLFLLIIMLMVEVASWIGIKIIDLRAPFLLYQAPEISKERFDGYIENRDPVLGWPGRKALESAAFDQSGSRPVPAFPQPGSECVSLYGDSFTYADDVDDEHAWGNLLARKLDCRVANWGVGGYGTDQALLRFFGHSEDRAPITLLGFFPENILRNINQYRYLLARDEAFSFKPRFILEAGRLRQVPPPDIAFSEWGRFVEAPGRFLSHENFLPDSRMGPIPPRFPYTSAIVKLLANERILGRLRGRPSWMQALSSDHPSQAGPLTIAIIETFAAQCLERGKRCAVVVFPSNTSFDYYRASGVSSIQPILLGLKERNIMTLNLTAGMSALLGEEGLCEVKAAGCGGHFTADGYAMIATLVYEFIRAQGWLPSDGSVKGKGHE